MFLNIFQLVYLKNNNDDDDDDDFLRSSMTNF